MPNRAEMRNVALLGRYGVDYRRKRGHDISEAHNISHLRNVADLTQLVADLYGFSDRKKELVYASAWFHDTVRSPSEDPSVADDEASANEAARILNDANGKNVIKTTLEERDAITFAIKQHGRFPNWLAEEKTRNTNPHSLEDKLWLALFVADKMEANGVRVIARRSSFVAGDRLKSEKGDWRNFGFEPDRDESLVVAIESILRLTVINPEEVYPDALHPLVHPLYEAQREFVLGICKASGLRVEDLAKILLGKKTVNGKNILEARKIKDPVSAAELVTIIASRGQITNEKIEAASNDVADSACETADYFSSRYRDDLDQLVQTWSPKNKKAKQWQKAMVEYNSGKWLKRKKEESRLA
ncbi:MAG: HD domain-containing protein, partial [Bdellovibrionota bacterium]